MVGHGDEQEDFTFPTVDGSLSHLNFSQFSPSPFWFVSKAAPEPADVVSEFRRGKSFSEAKNDRLRFEDSSRVVRVNSTLSDAVGARFLEAEEKMDLLWEDLNEELGVDAAWKMPSNVGETNFSTIPELDQARMEDLSSAKAMKNSKRGSLVPQGKSSLPVMFKVLKKLFLIHSPSRHKKV